MINPTPPRFADVILRALLAARDRDTVSGDLLEAYRDSIFPRRGRWRANAWYLRQVAGFAWRSNALWTALLATTFLVRTALDWFAPPADYHLRAAVTTTAVAGILVCASVAATTRTRSLIGGLVGGLTTTCTAAFLNVIGTTILLLIWRDDATRLAIERSGGLTEAFVLPLFVVAAGAAFGFAAGLLWHALNGQRFIRPST